MTRKRRRTEEKKVKENNEGKKDKNIKKMERNERKEARESFPSLLSPFQNLCCFVFHCKNTLSTTSTSHTHAEWSKCVLYIYCKDVANLILSFLSHFFAL